MLSAWAVLITAVCAASGDQLAFLSGTEQEDQTASILDLDSGAVTPVGPGSRDGRPVWSPDGQWLAFSTSQEGGIGIYVVRADGSEGRLLQHADSWNEDPVWSTDGCKNPAQCNTCGQFLVYTSQGPQGLDARVKVYRLADGHEEVWGGDRVGLLRPLWLPNINLMRALDPSKNLLWEKSAAETLLKEADDPGALLAMGIVGDPGKNLTTEIFVVTRTQTAPMLALLSDESQRYSEWGITANRDASRFAYESNDGGDREIHVIHKRGVTNVTNHREADWNPVWSSDGDWIAFESFRGGRRGVYAVFSDTVRILPIAASPEYQAWAPAWSPDGDNIAYVSDRSGDIELFVALADGSEARQLTNRPGPDLAPAWRPELKP